MSGLAVMAKSQFHARSAYWYPVASDSFGRVLVVCLLSMFMFGWSRQAETVPLCGTSPAATTPAPLQQGETSEGSDIALFLIGSGFALFIALLAWSEQIQSMKKDTRDLEAKFLSSTALDKFAFLSLMKSTNPDDQFDALSELLISAKLRHAFDVEALGLFRRWHTQSQDLEHLYLWKYRLTVLLTTFLFLAGSLTWTLTAAYSMRIGRFDVHLETFFAGSAVLLVLLVLVIVLLINQRERRFHELLTSISEKVL